MTQENNPHQEDDKAQESEYYWKSKYLEVLKEYERAKYMNELLTPPPFDELIHRTSNLSLEKQKEEIEKSLQEWINQNPELNIKQVDDILVASFRFNNLNK